MNRIVMARNEAIRAVVQGDLSWQWVIVTSMWIASQVRDDD